MTPEIKSIIESEIEGIKASMPNADPGMLEEYMRLLIEANADTTDSSKLIRPKFEVMTSRNLKLKNLRALYFSKKNRAIYDAVITEYNRPLDIISYEILREIRSL